MKKTIIAICMFAITANLYTSCNEKVQPSQEEIMKKNIEDYLIPQLNDPASYQFVRWHRVESVLISDIIKKERDKYINLLRFFESDLETEEKYENSERYNEVEVKGLKNKITECKLIIKNIDSLETQLGDNKSKPATITHTLIYRANNVFGGLVVNELIVITSGEPDFKLINIDGQAVDEAPVIPGFNEMMNNLKKSK